MTDHLNKERLGLTASIQGFPPLSRPDARILILGSMPSQESLARRRYYAHPRNSFWPIMATLLEITEESAYEERTEQVTARGIAIWDVLQSCIRPGSLDSAIDNSTMVSNDFPAFFTAHDQIRTVFFNGAKAESVYLRHVLPQLSGRAAELRLQRLPSTSPAHAGMAFEQKLEAWSMILE